MLLVHLEGLVELGGTAPVAEMGAPEPLELLVQAAHVEIEETPVMMEDLEPQVILIKYIFSLYFLNEQLIILRFSWFHWYNWSYWCNWTGWSNWKGWSKWAKG